MFRSYKRFCKTTPNVVLLTLKLHPGKLVGPVSINFIFVDRS